MKQPAIVLSFLVLTLTGCGQPSLNSSPLLSLQTTRASTFAVPSTKAEFVKAVATLGLKLTDAQLATISANRTAKPSGLMAPRPAANLTSEQNLQVHFKKHRGEFRPSFATAEEYLAQAVALAEGKRGQVEYYFDITSFKKGYQSNVVLWNSSTKELTAMRPDGATTTFYHDPSLNPNRFVVVPIF
ncbi:MAG TPA: hypothetical protein DD435_16490 [Cyanobacteria bacterium UBA8530]|nr:hypothetical protein [Cyanobacteria bacterium UBA8530]